MGEESELLQKYMISLDTSHKNCPKSHDVLLLSVAPKTDVTAGSRKGLRSWVPSHQDRETFSVCVVSSGWLSVMKCSTQTGGELTDYFWQRSDARSSARTSCTWWQMSRHASWPWPGGCEINGHDVPSQDPERPEWYKPIACNVCSDKEQKARKDECRNDQWRWSVTQSLPLDNTNIT